MEQISFSQSSLEIIQVCLKHFFDNSKIEEVSKTACYYLEKIEKIISGDIVLLSSIDFWTIHSYVITIFSGLLNNKGKVVKGKWSDKNWNNVLSRIEKCYDKDDTYEVSKMVK